ncbi:MAG: cytochrome-c oxidase, cbb3-type subunit III [Gammaproteobacteria bacterium]|nr:cytochrome-c oxidase, cbb3-type subunit III [Gammaproteobacteria bacterium]
MSDHKDNPFKNENNTGHIWDSNLRELVNPPPRWWMIGLHASWIFVLVYSLLYPTWPLISSHTTGLLGWTSIKEYKQDLQEIEQIRAPFEQKIATMSTEEILADSELSNYTVRAAKVLFGDNCSGCHGTNGAGNLGFPVLADDDWLYGGTVADIQASITDGRASSMPEFGSKLNAQQIQDVSNYVLGLSQGKTHEAGQAIFTEQGCFACHGMDAKGITAMGSANLADGIWRFSPGTLESVAYTITHGVNDSSDKQTRGATMPSFAGRLSETDIKKLSVFVHKLGGGK